MMRGLKFALGPTGYQAQRVAPNDPRLQWDAPFQKPLREVAGEIFPEARPEPKERPTAVVFCYTDEGGEWMARSQSIAEVAPAPEEIRRIQVCFDALAKRADDPRMPRARRAFLRHLRLPDPKQLPECWRLVEGRLFILWGLTKVGCEGTFSPYRLGAQGGVCQAFDLPVEAEGEAASVPEAPAAAPVDAAGGTGGNRVPGWLWGLLLALLGLGVLGVCARGCGRPARLHRAAPPGPPRQQRGTAEPPPHQAPEAPRGTPTALPPPARAQTGRWEIVEIDAAAFAEQVGKEKDARVYELRSAGGEAEAYRALGWSATCSKGPAQEALDFAVWPLPLDPWRVAVVWEIGRYQGRYQLELAADIVQTLPGGERVTTAYTNRFDFIHAPLRYAEGPP